MSAQIWHDQLHSRYCVSGDLLANTPLRISSGVANDETDAPFIRDAAGRPYIPGTSLRGAVRAELERTLCGLGVNVTSLESCVLFEKGCCADKSREKMKVITAETEEDERRRLLEELVEQELCDLCRLFGTTAFASRIYFKDAFSTQSDPKSDQCLVRDGVGIDRDTGSAVSGAKYDYEVFDPGDQGIPFSFSVTVENITDKDKMLVGLILRLLQEGLYVGGKRAGGLGKVQLEKSTISVTGFREPQEAWKRLRSNDPLMVDIENWEEVFKC